MLILYCDMSLLCMSSEEFQFMEEVPVLCCSINFIRFHFLVHPSRSTCFCFAWWIFSLVFLLDRDLHSHTCHASVL